MSVYTDAEGEFAVKVVRRAVEEYIQRREIPKFEFPEKFNAKSGVFTTISRYPSHALRGCIGFPEPVFPLHEALVKSAISAALDDPRFPPMRREELTHIVFEVSLLTPPEEIKVVKRKELFRDIKIGMHGLIAEHGFYRGLLLPQVPVEWGWKVKQFFEETCGKAGLPSDCWKDSNTRFYKFSAEIFEEDEPGGNVRRKKL